MTTLSTHSRWINKEILIELGKAWWIDVLYWSAATKAFHIMLYYLNYRMQLKRTVKSLEKKKKDIEHGQREKRNKTALVFFCRTIDGWWTNRNFIIVFFFSFIYFVIQFTCVSLYFIINLFRYTSFQYIKKISNKSGRT